MISENSYARRCWAEIDLDALGRNFRALRAFLRPETAALAVVKADAYGHGDQQIGRALEEIGVDWFGVACLDEALSLRRAGCRKPILVFGYTPPELAGLLIEHDLTQTMYSAEYAEAMQGAGKRLQVHVKLDTGMRRIGFRCEEEADLAAVEAVYRDFTVTGIFSHFSCADELSPDSLAFTAGQYAKFAVACDYLQARGHDPGLRHCSASSALILHEDWQLDMVRMGIALVGIAPSPEIGTHIRLEPVLTWRARVVMVKDLEIGEAVSYGRAFRAEKRMRVATIPAGYADGYARAFTNKGHMLLHGRPVPVLGRVCMDYCVVDVTDVPEAKMGDAVTLAGQDGSEEITFDALAALSGTISHDRVCAISPRVPRAYFRGGGLVEVRDYLTAR